MFAGKVHGAAHKRLLLYLVPLYQEGYNCLLRCPSIQQPHLATIIETTDELEKCEFEVDLILEVWNSKPYFEIVQSKITRQMQDIDHIISRNHSELELEILLLWRNYLLQNLSIASWVGGSVTVNEAADRRRQSSIPTVPMVDATRHLLYTALYHYRLRIYSAAISLLLEAKLKLQNPYLLYVWRKDIEKYQAAGGEQKPFTQKMKEILAWAVELMTDVTIQELTLEHQATDNEYLDLIAVPPLVFTNFISFLCYHHMGMVHEAQSMLQELSILVQYDDSYHISVRDKAISWQMLGICQEMSGDHKGAYQAYCNALQQKYCDMPFAPLARICVIIYKHLTGRC